MHTWFHAQLDQKSVTVPFDVEVAEKFLNGIKLIATNSSGPRLQRETEVPALCGACKSTLLNKVLKCPTYIVTCLTSSVWNYSITIMNKID